MIQFNLLPAVKLEYIRARRIKRTVIVISSAVSASALVLFLVLFSTVNFSQKAHLNNLQSDISAENKELSDNKDLAKILTVQNQLTSLDSLHAQKPVTSRIFGDLQKVTPVNAGITTLTIDWLTQVMKIDGSADTLATVNTFVDTLKFTTANVSGREEGATTESVQAFNEVVLTSFGVGSGDDGKTSFSVTLKYNPALYAGDKKIELVVPNQITTRSETEKPTLFKQDTGVQQ